MIHTVSARLLQVVMLSSVIALALGINYLSAWTGPTALPPGNNAPAPLNIGTTNQVKDANLSVGHAANTATDYGLVSYGRIRSTIGGFEFPDGTVQTSAASAPSTPSVSSVSNVVTFTSSGTWTKPAGLVKVEVEMWGGGGGSTAGGASVFSTVTAGGGATAGTGPASVSVGTVTGGPAVPALYAAIYGGGTAGTSYCQTYNTGGSGGCVSWTGTFGGGVGGHTIVGFSAAQLPATVSVTVGAGGYSAGPGIVQVTEYK